MAEGGEVSDADSDETIVEGSVVESDLGVEELQGKSLSLIGKDMALTTENNSAPGIRNLNGEKLSPEIQFIHQHSINLQILRQTELSNMAYQETTEEEESQSLLQTGINYPVIAKDTCQPDCPQAATVHGECKHCICLDSEMSGTLETSDINLLQVLNDEEDSQEIILLSNMNAIDATSKGSVPKYTEVSEAFHRVRMTSNKKDMTENGPPLERTASGVNANRIMTEKIEVKDLMEPLSDSESLQMLDILGYQDDAVSVDAYVNKESDAMPVELLAALNSLSESAAASAVCQQVGNGSGQSMAKKQLTPDQTDDDCTQITDTHLKSQLRFQHVEGTDALRMEKLPCLSEELINSEQYVNKLVHSDDQNIFSQNRPAEKGNYILKDISSCEQTAQATSCTLRKSAQKRKNITADSTSNCQQFLEGMHTQIYSYEAQTRLLAKDSAYDIISNIGDKDECSQLGINFHHCGPSDVNTKVEQVRKSQRIARKSRKQNTFKNCSSDASCNYISLSRINRRNSFGQTLLHRAAIEDDLNGLCAMINVGANVNAQDYAGWTPLHEASVAGCFETTNELLKAGADVNIKGSEKVTPLHDAVKEGHYKVAELLLWYGADPLFKNERGRSALEEATDKHMRKLLESYIAKFSRRSTSVERLVEEPGCDQNKVNKSQSQPKVKTSSSKRVRHSSFGNTKVLKQDSVKLGQNKRKRNPQSNSASKIQNSCRILNAKSSKGVHLVSKAKQSIRGRPSSSLGTSSEETRINDQSKTQNDSDHAASPSFTKRIVGSSVHPQYNLERICEGAEESSMNIGSEIQQESDSCNSNDCLPERREVNQSAELAGASRDLVTNSCTVTSLYLTQEASALSSVSVLVNESNLNSTHLLCKDNSFSLQEEVQGAMKLGNGSPCLKVGTLGNSLQIREDINPVPEKNRSPEQYMHSENSVEKIILDCHRGIILAHELDLKDTLSMTEEPIYLEENLLDSKNTTTLFVQGTEHLSDSDCTVLSEQDDLNIDQNPDKNTTKTVGICNEQTVQVSMEISSTCAFYQGINRIGVSGKPDTSSSSQLRIFTPTVHKGKTMGQTAEGNVRSCCLDENSSRMENDTFVIPQMLDKEPFQDCSHSSEKEETASSSQLMCSTTARINKRNTKGETRLHLAAKKGDLSLMKYLIASGACVNQKDNAGWTAIHEASNRGFTEIIAELLKAGADVNSKSLDGVLPIHDAVAGNHFEAVQFLLLHGANPNESDDCGKNALDETTCSKMKELLKFYGAAETKETLCMSNDVGEIELHTPRSRKVHSCYNCHEKDNLLSPLNSARQKCGTHESISKVLQDIEEKQGRLLCFELRSQKDADVYIQDLSQIQNILNTVLAKQKSERDELAKKYRASVESFKQGALRKQLVKLVSRQKSLLVMAQNQKELGQKIQNYKNARKESFSSTKLGACESSNTKDDISSKTVTCPDVVMGLETNWVMESNFLEQDPKLYPNRSLNVSGGNGATISEKGVCPQNVVFENNIEEAVNSKSSEAIDKAILPSEAVICLNQQSHLEEIDRISRVPQGNKLPNVPPNSSAAGSRGVNNINQLTTKTQHVCTNESLQQCSNINEAFHMQPVFELESTPSYLATHQNNNIPNNRISLIANLEPTGRFFQTLSQCRVSQNSSQSSNNQDSKNQLSFKANRRKKNQLLDLLEQGKIKPGDDVIEFTLQDSKHKASLLGNGKIRTGNNTIYQNLAQWIKAILGNDITVNWKYVAYCGTLLSKIIADVCVPKEPKSRLQQKPLFERNTTDWDHSQGAEYDCFSHKITFCQEVDNIQQKVAPFSQEEMEITISPEVETEEVSSENSSYQTNSSKTPGSFLQFNRIVLIKDEEFLPCHIMQQHWNLYVHCENFGF